MANEPYDANDEDQIDAAADPSAASQPGQNRPEPYLDEFGVTTYHRQRKMRNDVNDGLYDSTYNKLLKYDRAGTYYVVTPSDFIRLHEYNAFLKSVGSPLRVPPGSRSLQTTSVRLGNEIIRDVPVYVFDESTIDTSQPETDPPIPAAETSTVTPPPAPTRNPHPTREEVANDGGASINPVTGNTEVPAPANALPSLESQTPPDANDPRGRNQIPDVTGPAPVTANCGSSSSSTPSAAAPVPTTPPTNSSTTPSTSSSSTTPTSSSSSSVSSADAPIPSSGPVYQYRPITQFADRYDFRTGKKIRE